MKLLRLPAFLLCSITFASAVPVPQWGPNSRQLFDGAFAKEALDTDNSGRCYSAGFETLPNVRGLVLRRDASGNNPVPGFPPPALMGAGKASVFAGVDADVTGAFSFAAGTFYPAWPSQATSQLLVVKFDAAMNPVASYLPAAIGGLTGNEMSGCRVIIAPFNVGGVPVIFVCGCSENGNFVLPLTQGTLAPFPSWGTNGAFSVGGSCPKHPMPGIFTNQPIFSNCRQSFIELSGQTLYLAGTLSSNFSVARLSAATGALIFGWPKIAPAGTNQMKALAVSGNPTTALVTVAGGNLDVGWRASGLPVFSGLGTALMPGAQTMNDVESAPGMVGNMPGNFVHIGGKNAGSGRVFRFWFPVSGWNNGQAVLQFAVNYGSLATDEAYDLAIGSGGWLDWTFATGGKGNAGSYDAPLLEVAPTGVPLWLAAPTNGQPTWPDRGNAAHYHAGGTVFTHGNQQSVPVSWDGRSVRWNP